MNTLFKDGDLIASRFQVRAPIGSGDLGQVFEVWDLASANVAALKQFSVPKALDTELAARVGDGARRGAGASPTIVRALHVGTTNHGLYVVTERLGPSLELRRLPPHRVGPAFMELCAALDEAHRVGRVHGDLHPRNLFAMPDGSVRTTDFGIWPFRAATPTPWAGLPGWTAPEVVQGQPPSPRSDVYALALVMFYALSGATLFRSLSTGRIDLNALWAEMNGSIDVLARLNELGVPLHPTTALLLGRALSVDPSLRPSTSSELAAGVARTDPSGNHTSGAHAAGTMVLGRHPSQSSPPRPPSHSAPGLGHAVPPAPVAQSSERPSRPSQSSMMGAGGTVAIPASVLVPSGPPPAPTPVLMPPPSGSSPPPPAQKRPSSGPIRSGTMVADASAFPELALLSAFNAPAQSATGQSPANPSPPPAPPPVVRQAVPSVPAPPAFVDPKAHVEREAEPQRQDWSTVAFAEAARAEWARARDAAVQHVSAAQAPVADHGRSFAPSARPGVKRSTIVIVAGVLVALLIVALILLYLLLRMDDSAKFPAPKQSLLESPSAQKS